MTVRAGRTCWAPRANDLLLVWIGLLLVFLYWQFGEAPVTDLRMRVHASILDGEANAPFQYRVLAPYTTEAARRALRPALGPRASFHLAYLAWNALWTVGLLLVARRFFCRWLAAPWPLVGALLLGFTLTLAFAEQVYAPWSVAEPVLLLLGVEAWLAARPGLALVVVLVASLNRETAVLIPVAMALLSIPRLYGETSRAGSHTGRWWAAPLAGFLVWGAAFAGLRAAYGPRPAFYNYPELVWLNAGPGQTVWAALFLVLLLGPVWVWAASGWRRAPVPLRRLGLLVPLLVLLWLVFGRWREVRVLVPVVPILIPLALLHLRRRGVDREGELR